MKFLKIKDGVIIKQNSLTGYHKEKYDKNGCHYYIAKYNEDRKAFDMYPTSHYIDPKKVTDIRKDRAILMKIKGVKGFSTVYNVPRSKNVHGQYFLNDNEFEQVGELSKSQIKRFNCFINKRKKKRP